ncbi:MAG: hypothetical protein JST00_10015 [Deltaproteobacteria bacterium]|nr:hypothetical protein [Deltaproteobacteria bacterium]
MRRGFLAALALSLPGCLLLTDLAGLSEGPADGGASPADAEAGATFDGSPDAGLIDGSADASVDGPFCATQGAGATFCADFEEGLLPVPWADEDGYGRATLDVDDLRAKTGRRSLVAACPSLTGSDNTKATLRKPLVASLGERLTIEFSIRPETYGNIPGGGWASVAFESQDSSQRKSRLYFRISATTTQLLEASDLADGGVDYAETPDQPPLPLDTWTTVRIEAQLSASSSKFLLDINGVRVGQFNSNIHRYRLSPTLIAGFTFLAAPTTPWRVRFDDFVVRHTP